MKITPLNKCKKVNVYLNVTFGDIEPFKGQTLLFELLEGEKPMEIIEYARDGSPIFITKDKLGSNSMMRKIKLRIYIHT